jgi:hypothetical protein
LFKAGFDQAKMQEILSDPEVLEALQDPSVMAKLQAIMSGDMSKIAEVQNDPKLRKVMSKFMGA